MEDVTKTKQSLQDLMSEIKGSEGDLHEVGALLKGLEQDIVSIDDDLRAIEESTETDINLTAGQLEEAFKDLNNG